MLPKNDIFEGGYDDNLSVYRYCLYATNFLSIDIYRKENWVRNNLRKDGIAMV